MGISQHNDKYSIKFDYKWKKHRWYAWDLNLVHQIGRCRLIYRAMVPPAPSKKINILFPSFLMLIKTPIQDIAFFFYPTYSSEQNDLMNN